MKQITEKEIQEVEELLLNRYNLMSHEQSSQTDKSYFNGIIACLVLLGFDVRKTEQGFKVIVRG